LGGTIKDSRDEGGAGQRRAVSYLALVLECDRPTVGGASVSLEGAALVHVGRGAARTTTRRQERDATILDVRVPAQAMSTEHGRFVRAGSEWVVEDSGSTNGTHVNGVAVSRAVVGEGDVITMGRTIFALATRMAPIGAPEDVDLEAVPEGRHATLDPELHAQLEALARVSRSALTVLVRGESGTGKELLARTVHEESGRRGAFVPVNCGAIPANLIESYLFGHVRGAFSGAVRDEIGVFRAADGGTLFLDEIGDLPPPSQAALLRALQEREVTPVGAPRAIKVDLRVVAATHQPLEAMCDRGEFRRDLLARIAGFSIALPPLRDRGMDLGVLVASLLRSCAPAGGVRVRFAPPAAEALVRYGWPLNTRELEQCLSRALVLAGDGVIRVEHLPEEISRPAAPSRAPEAADALGERDRKLRLELLEQLARHGGNLADVAREMGKARMQVHRWCKRFGIDPNLYRR
jgi:DNA-binding NtrC family response regulator